MPFRYRIDEKLDIVVLKATGAVSAIDIISEVQEAINTKRGLGVSRRLIDMTEIEFSFNEKDARKILSMMQVQGKTLGTVKVAVLFTKVPKSFDFSNIRGLLNTEFLEIGVFTNKANAVTFLNSGGLRKK